MLVLALYEETARNPAFFGFISTQLHRGIAGSSVFVNYAVWESTEHYKRAFNNSEFQSKMVEYPASTMASPHLFKKIAVSGICVE